MRFGRRRKYIIPALMAAIMAASLMFGFLLRYMEQPFITALSEYADTASASAVNSAVDNCLGKIEYKDLIVIDKDISGKIVSMSANGIKISGLKSEIHKHIIDFLRDYPEKSVTLKTGSATGNIILAATGPDLKIKLHPYSEVKTEFRDEFVSAGINQVRHCIYLDISFKVTVVSTGIEKNEAFTDSVLITDTVISGAVPDFCGFSKTRE